MLCFECGDQAHHQHHVVPRANGGTKTVPLCRIHHAAAHGNNGEAPQGYMPAMPQPLADLAAELYEDGWTLQKKMADFYNAAGFQTVKRRGTWRPTSFRGALRRAGVTMRPKVGQIDPNSIRQFKIRHGLKS